MAALAEDEELDDIYRPEMPARPRAGSRVSPRQPTSQADFAPVLPRGRAPYDDLDEDLDFPFEDEPARPRRRVPVRKGGWLSTRWGKIGLGLAILAVLAVLTTTFLLVRNFFLEDPRFRIETASSIQILGNSQLTRNELLSVFGSDVGHNIFRVPLAQRRAALQQLPWVEHATVMRLLPNQIRASIVERIPVAFVRAGNKVELVDATGVLLTMPPAMLAARHYSFPVVSGINASDPAETRAERMQIYEKFISELNSLGESAPGKPGPAISEQLSEVDVSDPEDVRAIMPSAGTDILVHFGDDDFAARYKTYQQHLSQWRQQYPHLAAIDLRYDRQTVLQMDKGNPADAVDTTPVLSTTPAPRKPSAKKPAKPSPKTKSKTAASKTARART
jgi:cell division protein FtsQ